MFFKLKATTIFPNGEFSEFVKFPLILIENIS